MKDGSAGGRPARVEAATRAGAPPGTPLIRWEAGHGGADTRSWRTCPHLRWIPGDRYATFEVSAAHAPLGYHRQIHDEVRDRARQVGLAVREDAHLCKALDGGREQWVVRLATAQAVPA